MKGYELPPNARGIGMRALLRDMPSGVPADCLLARIRGRRSFLIRDWDRLLLTHQPLAALSPAPWRGADIGAEMWAQRALQQEYFWAFSRMDEDLRRSTSPFFWLAELRTLAVCLRLLTGGGTNLDRLLQRSLLANSIVDLLRKADGSPPAVAGLANMLAGYDPVFDGLAGIYRAGGSGALEEALYEKSLQSLAHSPLHPQMRSYCALMIDSRNLTTTAKRLRWRLDNIPPLLESGTIPPQRLAELFRSRDSAGLLHIAMRLGGEAPYSENADLERVLYEAQGRVMSRMARAADDIGAILHYLWRCGNEAANIGLLQKLDSAGIEHAGVELRR